LAPTGDAITGRPAAMYWTILKPLFPRVQRVSGRGAMPTSPRESASASPASDQGTCSRGSEADSRPRSEMMIREEARQAAGGLLEGGRISRR
jgi:hypothetical protein